MNIIDNDVKTKILIENLILFYNIFYEYNLFSFKVSCEFKLIKQTIQKNETNKQSKV